MREEHVLETAALYAQVFGEEPWNEKWSSKRSLAAVKNPQLTWWVAIDQDVVIGFVAGYITTPDTLSKDYKVPRDLLTGSSIGYKAEVAVAPDFRRKGLARKLTRTLLEYFREQDIDQFIVRTRKGTKNHPWYADFLDLIHTFGDGRVIFGWQGVPDL